MDNLLTLAISNSLAAGGLAVIASVTSWTKRSPQLAHVLWVLVLIKLITPPITIVPVADFKFWNPADQQVTAYGSSPLSETPRSLPVASRSEEFKNSFLPSDLHGGLTKSERATAESVMLESIQNNALVPEISSLSGQFLDESEGLGSTVRSGPSSVEVIPEFSVAETNPPESSPTAHVEDLTPVTALETDTARITEVLSTPAVAFSHVLSISGFFLCLWCVGSVFAIALLCWRCFRFRRVPKFAQLAPAELQNLAAEFARLIRLKRVPHILIADLCIPPLVWGMSSRPVIVLPRTLLKSLGPEQQRAVLMHELAHVKRRDYVVRWIEAVVLSLFWWNPLAWWARHRMRDAEEECCDAWVVWALPDSRKAYGQALLKTVEFLTESPRVPSLAGTAFGGSPFKRRIEMILNRPINRSMSRWSFLFSLLLAAAILPVAAQDVEKPAATDRTTDRTPLTAESTLTEPPEVVESVVQATPPEANVTTPSEPTELTAAEEPNDATREKPAGKSGRVSSFVRNNTRSTAATIEKRRLETLARLEERLIRLEKIVEALARSQQRHPSGANIPGPPSGRTSAAQPTRSSSLFSRSNRTAPGTTSRPPQLSSAVRSRNSGATTAIASAHRAPARVAVSPGGKFVASLSALGDSSIVDLFDADSGRQLSRVQAPGKATTLRFIDEKRIQITGDGLNHVIAVPSGEISRHQTGSSLELTSPSGAGKPKSATYAIAAGKELSALIETLKTQQDDRQKERLSLRRDVQLLELEVELEETKRARSESALGRSRRAELSDVEIEQLALEVKQATLEVEKAKTLLSFKQAELKRAEELGKLIEQKLNETLKDFGKRFPDHPAMKKHSDLLRKDRKASN